MADRDLWRLPGPASYVSAIATSAERSQNVAAILPMHALNDRHRSGHLVNAIRNELSARNASARPIRPYEDNGLLVEALGCAITGYEPPVTVRELLTHADAVGRVLVCDTSEFGATHIGELCRLLTRIEVESRGIPSSERGTFVFVTDRGNVPEFTGGGRSDVTFVSHWFWNRTARWDSAALVVASARDSQAADVLQELRTETIVELARWDLTLASDLAANWSGLEADLIDFVAVVDASLATGFAKHLTSRNEPGPALAEHWDRGLIEAWHERVELSPAVAIASSESLSQRIWTAQSRVLLPWIEQKRQLLEKLVSDELGQEPFMHAIEDANRGRDYDKIDPECVEIGPLFGIVRTYLRRKESWLSAARRLKEARNDLAHLKPIPQTRVDALVKECTFLR